jgi:adenylate cyclase
MKKIARITFILTASFFSCLAQNHHLIDSLKNELHKFEAPEMANSHKPIANRHLMDSMKAAILDGLSHEYMDNNPDTAMQYAQQELSLSSQTGYKDGKGNAWNNMGLISCKKGDYTKALDYTEKAFLIFTEIHDKNGLATSYYSRGNVHTLQSKYPESMNDYLTASKLFAETGNKQGIANTCNSLGSLYSYEGNYPAALASYLKALKINEEMGYKQQASYSYNRIGRVYEYLDKNQEALKNEQASLKIEQEIGDKDDMATSYNYMGTVYFQQKKYSEALANEQKALKLAGEVMNKNRMAWVYNAIGDIYLDQSSYQEALQNYQEALQIEEELRQIDDIASTTYRIGGVYQKMGLLSEALEYETRSLSLALEAGQSKDIMEAYKSISEINIGLNNYKEAYENEVLYNQYYDTIYSNKNEMKLADIQMQYNFDRSQDSVKAVQGKKDAIAKEEIQNQKNVRNFLFGGIFLGFIFSGFIFRSLKVSRRQKIAIEKENLRSDELLLNILPAEVAKELKEKGSAEAKSYDEVTVLFTDFKDFTKISENLSAEELVAEIDYCFKGFDRIIETYGIEKIKTIGDSYMAAGGLPVPDKTQAKNVVNAALEILEFMKTYNRQKIKEALPHEARRGNQVLEIRIGINTGPVVAGIVGVKKFAYDIWGDTVNLASRMESSGEVGKVNISGSTYELVKNDFTCTYRGKIQAKNKGEVDMYFVS